MNYKLEPTRIKSYREPEGEWIVPNEEGYFMQSCNGNWVLYCRKIDDEEYRRVDMYYVREILWDLDYKEKHEPTLPA